MEKTIKGKKTMIYLVRHGETDWNLKHRMQGITDVPLNETGLSQAEAIGKHLKNVQLDILYVSPLTRARQTAAAIHRHHNETPIEIRPDIVEQSYGRLEGLVYEELDKLHPAKTWKDSWQYHQYRTPGGESLQDVYNRVDTFIEEIIPINEGKNVLIVAHGVTLRLLVGAFLHLPINQLGSLHMLNASLAILEDSPVHGRSIHISNYLP